MYFYDCLPYTTFYHFRHNDSTVFYNTLSSVYSKLLSGKVTFLDELFSYSKRHHRVILLIPKKIARPCVTQYKYLVVSIFIFMSNYCGQLGRKIIRSLHLSGGHLWTKRYILWAPIKAAKLMSEIVVNCKPFWMKNCSIFSQILSLFWLYNDIAKFYRCC